MKAPGGLPHDATGVGFMGRGGGTNGTEVSSRGGQMLRSRGRRAGSAFWCRLLRWISVSSPWGQAVLPRDESSESQGWLESH